eukprot:TRINITY_DN24935_c0_g1_i2.p1 TRINITY_DN24935_c0_g1~~TRINITY_DN24935_c0_g1_i2.p1  ORF type:complete len:472 (-),score=85.84 TRINITY_DN24935_c0_g1_i2:62-1441(-)
MVAQSCVPRPSCSPRFQELVTTATLASDQKDPQVTELLAQLMHVQQESLSRLLKWSQGHGIAVDAITLSGYVEEMKRIISQSRSIISALDEKFSKLNLAESSQASRDCGHPATRYPPTPLSVPEARAPPPPPAPMAPGHQLYPSQHRPPPADSHLPPPPPPPGYSVPAQPYPASGSFPHPPVHPPPDDLQGHLHDAGRHCDWDVDARRGAEKRRRTGGTDRDEEYEWEKQPKYKSEASEAEIKDFLDDLPAYKLTANEEKMRAALLEAWQPGAGLWSKRHARGRPVEQGVKMSFSYMCSNEAVRKAKANLLPPGMSIERWMEERIPELFSVSERYGHMLVYLKESEEDRELRMQEQRDAKENESNEFLEGLPKDDLSAEEHDMREALLAAWKRCVKKFGEGKVRLSHLGQQEDVRKAKSALLPAAVTVRQWIEARIGEELILSEDDDKQLMATFPRESC